MKVNSALVLIALSLSCSSASRATVTFDFATIGNPGNADDLHGAGYGGVNYLYRISKHEVTNAQYTEFLNLVDPTGANSSLGGEDGRLYNGRMSSDARGGINYNPAASNGAKYEVKPGRDNNPVVFVSFFDAMRFTNWLHNGQGANDTELGVYAINVGSDEVRSAHAKFWIPSEHEWYKAAYYDPTKGIYYDYPTGTNIAPYSDSPFSLNAPDITNVGNFLKNDSSPNGYDDGFAVTGSGSYLSSQNYLTDVGAYSMATSPYGTFDQGGNAWEWNDTTLGTGFRTLRGGAWSFPVSTLQASERHGTTPYFSNDLGGFRVATVAIPEPSSILLAATLVLMGSGRRYH